MPYVLEYNRKAIDERLTRLAAYLGLPNPSFKSVLDWILALRKEIGIPHTLKEHRRRRQADRQKWPRWPPPIPAPAATRSRSAPRSCA